MAKSKMLNLNKATPNISFNPKKLEYYGIVERGRVEKRTCIELMFHSGYIELYFETNNEACFAINVIDSEV